MDCTLLFFVGMLVACLVEQAGQLAHQAHESRRRQLVARIRADMRDERHRWDYGELYRIHGMPATCEKPRPAPASVEFSHAKAVLGVC